MLNVVERELWRVVFPATVAELLIVLVEFTRLADLPHVVQLLDGHLSVALAHCALKRHAGDVVDAWLVAN